MSLDSPRPFPKNSFYAHALATAWETRESIARGIAAPTGMSPYRVSRTSQPPKHKKHKHYKPDLITKAVEPTVPTRDGENSL